MAYNKQQKEKKFTEVCRLIGEEGKSLRKALIKESMGSKTFYKWLDEDEVKEKQYTRATTLRAEEIFEEILQIADTPQEGITTKENDQGLEISRSDMIQHRRLQVDARKWMLGKMNPKKYSDKIQVDSTEFSEQPLFPDVPTDNSNK
jgi:hypothetical protein